MTEQLHKLVVRYGDCEQKPVRLRPGTWGVRQRPDLRYGWSGRAL
ncbi:hypothetical protein [Streptomyces spinoverrucosus]|nr:hypothetical protein [Streptomyces spinoverrucosus]